MVFGAVMAAVSVSIPSDRGIRSGCNLGNGYFNYYRPVSIPSDRGIRSGNAALDLTGVDLNTSQSPLIGAFVPGNMRRSRIIVTSDVSIPSDRGIRSGYL